MKRANLDVYWRDCGCCGELFLPRRPAQTTCSRRCARNVAHLARKPWPREPSPLPALRRFQLARGQAYRRVVPWELAIEDYAALIAQPCHYCGGPLFRHGIGLDQVVPGAGYVHGNVVPCCWICNSVKGELFTLAEMLELGAVIARITANWPKAMRERRSRR